MKASAGRNPLVRIVGAAATVVVAVLVITHAPATAQAEPEKPAGRPADAPQKSKPLTDAEVQDLVKAVTGLGQFRLYVEREIPKDAKIDEATRRRIEEAKQKFPILVAELRRRLPYESLADRLAYEALRPKSASTKLSDETGKHLGDTERALNHRRFWSPRAVSLRMLHTDEVKNFIGRDNFGMLRAPEPSLRYLTIPEAAPIPIPTVLAPSADEFGSVQPLARDDGPRTGGPRMPTLTGLRTVHLGSTLDFLDPSYFGHVKDREHVAGFQPHQFRQMPSMPGAREKNEDRWRLTRLELVSLLKHDQAAVYVSDDLPRMERNKKARTRSLTDFESDSLKALQGGEEMFIEARTNVIRMVGAIRTTSQCVECHQVPRGALLGAFTYEMQRDPLQAVPAVK